MEQKVETLKSVAPLTIEIINEWSKEEEARKLDLLEKNLNRRLLPEMQYELARQEMLERRIHRMQEVHKINNLVGEFSYAVCSGRFEDAFHCFALDTEDCYAEITNIGIYQGKESLKKYFVDYCRQLVGQEGCFQKMEFLSPVVELAEDGQTAKASYLVMEMIAAHRPDFNLDYPAEKSIWCCGPYAIDFVLENGEWKIWHLTIFKDVETTYEESWSEISAHPIPVDPSAPVPDTPSGKNHPFSVERKPYLHIAPPVPYRTYGKEKR